MADEKKDMKDDGPNNGGPLKGKLAFKGMAVWMLLIALFLALFQLMPKGDDAQMLGLSAFKTLVAEGNVGKCVIVEQGDSCTVEGERLNADVDPDKPLKFRVDLGKKDDTFVETRKLLDTYKVSWTPETRKPSILVDLVSGILPIILLIGVLYFIFNRQMKSAGKGAMSFGKSRARLLKKDENPTTFTDVAGVDEAKEEVQEIIEFLRDPKRFTKLGGRIPKGVMLVGPPGTGKTLLAKAIAGEADVPFFSISGSDFVEMFVGVGASRVRDMFEQGKKSAPCIIFIDEIDAVGRSRFTGIGGGHDEREQTLNALLVEMDGFETQDGVIIVAATNRPDVLDPALLRPGRFDRQIVVDLPTLEGRLAVLKIHARKVKLGKDVNLRSVARGTPGFSGADLANLINEGALEAARRSASAIETCDLEEARDKVCWGRENRGKMLDEDEKRLTAYHEAGHTIVLHMANETEPLHKVTIIPRGQALGATMQLPQKDRYSETRQRMLDRLAMTMGGRVAEELVFNDLTTGAAGDLKQATHIARLMVCEWGMSEVVGPQSFGSNQEMMFLGREVQRTQEHSEETARLIDSEVSRLLREANQRAVDLLTEHREQLDLIAEKLIERETLHGYEVAELMEHGRILEPEERKPEVHEDDVADDEAKSAEKPAEKVAESDDQAAEKPVEEIKAAPKQAEVFDTKEEIED